jgi:hypothetical protein
VPPNFITIRAITEIGCHFDVPAHTY